VRVIATPPDAEQQKTVLKLDLTQYTVRVRQIITFTNRSVYDNLSA
jgi:hypothetical protein